MLLQVLAHTSSTMDVARENLLCGRVTFTPERQARCAGVLAQEQTAGRGQRGRPWFAPKGEALCATYYYRRGLTDPQHAGEIALIAGVAVAHTLQSLLQEAEVYVGLKWPNDLIVNGKKLGGVLIEMVKTPDDEWTALIGVGINVGVKEFPPELRASATSLYLEGLREVEIEALALSINERIQEMGDRRRDTGLATILDYWHLYDVSAGRRYRAEIDGETHDGIAEGLDEAGALQLRLEDGKLLAVSTASSLRTV
ncbi:MAG: biotin--[acetyl-CoA-carboxylase] ligase [Chthonomonadaceae bacterium]|nr:biotin--[acetyl-CoA-carboxylase] ligase [Chthonomonadaceae bacterium]